MQINGALAVNPGQEAKLQHALVELTEDGAGDPFSCATHETWLPISQAASYLPYHDHGSGMRN